MKLKMIRIVCAGLFASFMAGALSAQPSSDQGRKPLPTPGRTPVARTDSTKPAPENKEKSLPTIQLKNYVITGDAEVDLPDPEKRRDAPQRVLQRAMDSEVDEHRASRALTSDPSKPIRYFETPEASRMNSFQAGYGRYGDVLVAAQAARTYQQHDAFAELDFHRTSGFIDNADETTGKLRIGDAYKLSDRAMGNVGILYRYDGYKFYGADPLSGLGGMQRTLHNFGGDARADISASDKASISLEAGGNFGKVGDDDGLDDIATDLIRGGAHIRIFAGRHLIVGDVKAQNHSYSGDIRHLHAGDDHFENTLRTYSAKLGFEGTVYQGLHIRIGGQYYGAKVQRTTNDAEVSKSKFYPYAYASKMFPGIGEIFAEFHPEITGRSIDEWLMVNRYLDPSTPISYTDYPINIRTGWRKKTEVGVSLEVSYLFKKVEHLGIETDSYNSGMWLIDYGGVVAGDKGYTTEIQGIQAVTDWQLSEQFSLWGAASVVDYSSLNDPSGGNIPYHANVNASAMAQFLPGHGFRLELSGRYVGSRYTNMQGSEELDPYVLLNFHLGKRFAGNFEAGVSVFNILNQDFEIRRGYLEPDMVSAGVLRVYW